MGYRPLIVAFILLNSNYLLHIDSASDESNVANILTNCTIDDLQNINDTSKKTSAPLGLSYKFLHCNFGTIPNAFLANVSHLRSLEVCSSKILSIRSDALGGLTKLETLRVVDNPNLTRFNSWSAETLDELIELDLRENGIKTLDKTALHRYPNLMHLNLHRNAITSIPIDFLGHSVNLETLNLAENLLQRIDPDTLKSLLRLVDLNLAHNRIDFIDAYAFTTTTHLKVLRLNGNRIKAVQSMAFFNLGRLEFLNLSENALNAYALEEDAFKQNHQLRHLDMSHNSMFAIMPNTLSGLNALQVSECEFFFCQHARTLFSPENFLYVFIY